MRELVICLQTLALFNDFDFASREQLTRAGDHSDAEPADDLGDDFSDDDLELDLNPYKPASAPDVDAEEATVEAPLRLLMVLQKPE